METVFADVMLESVEFERSGNTVSFKFYNLINGNSMGEIICRSVFAFNFHSTFIADEECLPCLVLDVKFCKLEYATVKEEFKKQNYGFTNSNSVAVPESKEYHLFIIEGAPIYYSVICQQIEVIKCKIY